MYADGYMECPLCDADVPVSEEDRVGDILCCSFCESSLALRKKSDVWDCEEYYLDEDFG